MREIFTCQCCGHCCHGKSTVSVSLPEQEDIASFLGVDLPTFLKRFCRERDKRVEMKIIQGHCVFYGENGLCEIHAVKPFHCRRWPLHPAILGDRGAWEAIRADCPGFTTDATYEEVCGLAGAENDGN
jgi:Fe-S-cluster containining protein